MKEKIKLNIYNAKIFEEFESERWRSCTVGRIYGKIWYPDWRRDQAP